MQTNSSSQSDPFAEDAPRSLSASRIRADFEGLLELAEKLQTSRRQFSERCGQLAFIQESLRLAMSVELSIGLLIGVNCFSPSIAFFGKMLEPIYFALLVGGIDTVFGFFTIRYFLMARQQARHQKQALFSDERDLSEVVELLREIEPVYAHEEKLSAMERVQIRIRLSRFGIGSSSHGAADSTKTETRPEFFSRESRGERELLKPS